MAMNINFLQRTALALLCAGCAANALAASHHFAKVPSDTPVYIGTTFDDNWVSNLGLGDVESLRLALSKFGKGRGEQSAGGKFGRVIAEALLQGGNGGLALVAQPGRAQLYLQGAAPVLRLKLRDGDQFRAYMHKRAGEVDAAVQATKFQSQPLWAPVADNTEAYAALDGDDLVLGRWADEPGYPDIAELVRGGAGFDAEGGVLARQHRYQMPGNSVGWLDLKQLQDSVANPEHALHQAVQSQVLDQQKWQLFLSDECQADIDRFVANTPHLLGSAQYTGSGEQSRLKTAFVWPMQEQKSRDAWQALQGSVLSDSGDDIPAHLSFGISGAGVGNYINYMAADLAKLQCPLWRDQATKAGMGLAMGSSMSAMFGSVKGVTAQLFDIELSTDGKPDPLSADAQISVLTDSPSLLLLMMRSMLTLPSNIPEDGTPVSVNTPFGIPLQLAVYPHSINIFQGERARASVAGLKSSLETESAFFNYAMDIAWVMEKFTSAASGKSPDKLLRDNGAEALIPLSATGGVRHLPYGIRMDSDAIYAKPEIETPAGAIAVKAKN